MSYVISPKTGRTIKVGGNTYNKLLKDPEYADFFATPEKLSSLPKATVALSSPPLSPRSLPPLESTPIFEEEKENKSKSKSKKNSKSNSRSDLKTADHLTAVLSMPLYKVPSLEEVLARTRQPHLRERLQRMIREQKSGDARTSRSRAWSSRSPKRGNDRNQLMEECGSKCFLKPDTKGFPICPKCQLGDGACICKIDPGAVFSAKIRAAQYGYPEVVKMVDKIIESKGLKK